LNIKGLAESIILQSFEDLWIKNYRKDSENFFTGDTFCLCADIAGMSALDQIKMLYMVKSLKTFQKTNKTPKNGKEIRLITYPSNEESIHASNCSFGRAPAISLSLSPFL